MRNVAMRKNDGRIWGTFWTVLICSSVPLCGCFLYGFYEKHIKSFKVVVSLVTQIKEMAVPFLSLHI